jgi:hypothetical protein
MSITTQVDIEAPWPPEQCPSWCAFTSSHKAGEHPDDRHHSAEGIDVPLSIDYGYTEEALIVALRQYAGGDIVVELTANDRTGLLTLAEARDLIAALSEALDLAGQGVSA